MNSWNHIKPYQKNIVCFTKRKTTNSRSPGLPLPPAACRVKQAAKGLGFSDRDGKTKRGNPRFSNITYSPQRGRTVSTLHYFRVGFQQCLPLCLDYSLQSDLLERFISWQTGYWILFCKGIDWNSRTGAWTGCCVIIIFYFIVFIMFYPSCLTCWYKAPGSTGTQRWYPWTKQRGTN